MADETRIIRIVVDASKAVDGSAAATRALERLEKQQGQAASSLDRMEKAMVRVGGYMKAQLALMAAELAARLVQIGKDAFNAASGMGELADQLGITTRGLQALQYSAVQNGVKLEQLETGVSKFSQKIGEAAGGSREMIESLNGMGVKILDLNGKLRPTETLMQEVASSILAIDDPAKRSAASVDFFGKAGSKFLPVLQDLAKGLDAMAAAADRGGAMISDRAIARLDELGDAASRSALRLRASFANGFVEVLDEIEARLSKINIGFSEADWAKGAAFNKRKVEEFSSFLGRMEEEAAVGFARFIAGFATAISTIPDLLGKAFVDGMNNALAALESGLSRITVALERNAPWLGVKSGDFSLGRLSGGGASLSGRNSQIQGAENQAEAGVRADFAAGREQRERAALIAAQAGYASEEDAARRGKLGGVDGGGRSNPTVKGAGGGVSEKVSKLLRDGNREAEAANAMAEASERGARAVADLETHYKALKAAQDAYGDTATQNTGQVTELTARLEALMSATDKARGLKDFNIGTEALERSNELLRVENSLINATIEDRSREIALIRSKHEAESKGLDVNGEKERELINRRAAAIEQNETLKAQGEEMRKVNELWTAPLKKAMESIQQTSADAFDSMLQNGKFSFQSLGDVFKVTIRRMIAEFLALATVRPVMNVVVQAMSGAGLMSSGTASSLGMGGSGGGTGGMGGFSMPSFGGGGWLSDFMAMTPFAGSAPTGGFASIDALMASGQAGASAGWSAGGLSGALQGLSVGSLLGAAGGIGSGIFQLATGGGSTGSTIGGIGSMIGGLVSLVPGIGQIAGPLIMMASALAPSLFGESDTRTHSSTNANLRYGSGGWYTTGGAWGAGAHSGQGESALRGATGGIDSIFDLAGGVKDASRVWGMNASSWTAQGKDWSYTSNATHLVDPNGNRTAWRMNENGMMDSGAAQVAVRSILGGAVGEISASMKTALTAMTGFAPTMQEVARNITFVTDVYERFGKGVLSIKPSFDELTKRFEDMADTATKLGLSLDPVEAEQKKATERFGQDFIDGMLDPLQVQLRALADQRAESIANAEYIRDHVKNVYVDINAITEYWLKREADLREQYLGGAVDSIEAALKRLTLGDLANVSPTTQFTGLKATYNATLAQARAGDSEAIGRIANEAMAFAESGRGQYASSPEYDAIVAQIRRDLAEILAAAQGPRVGSNGGALDVNNPGIQTIIAANEQLQEIVATLTAQVSQQSNDLAALTAQLRRIAVNQG